MAMRSENDFAPTHQSPQILAEPNRSRQLDFYQAMSDFKHMFPEMDEEVIEAVLRANSGAVDATIDQLLTMNIDNEDEASIPREFNLQLFKEHKANKSVEQPPPYSEAIKSNPPPRPARTRPPAESPSHQTQSSTPQPNLLDIDVRSFASSLAASGNTTPKTIINSSCEPNQKSLPTRARTTKAPYKHYNPPLLGALPDDFLRLSPPIVPERTHRTNASISSSIHQSSSPHRTSSGAHRGAPSIQRSASLTQTSPRTIPPNRHTSLTHTGRSQSQASRHHHSNLAPVHVSSQGAGGHSPSHLISHTSSHSVTHSTHTPSHLSSRDRNKTTTSTERNKVHVQTPTSLHGANRSPSRVVSHEISSSMLQRKLKENAWRRRSAPTSEEDPETAQYLDDERIAIILQNREFLQELRDDKDFMATLDEDATKDEDSVPEVEKVNTSPLSESQQEGYGEDVQDSPGAFPFTAPSGQMDNDTELRNKLSNMGKASKTHFASIAKKFFTIRKKKYPKPLLRDTVAPSMINLLDEDYNNGYSADSAYDADRYTTEDTRRQISRPRISYTTSNSSVI